MLGTKMDVQINYARINRRVAAYIVDQMTFILFYSLFYVLILFISSGESLDNIFHYVFSDTDTTLISERHEILEDLELLLENLAYIVLEVLMIIKLGWTPGKLLCGIRIRHTDTLENISLVQAAVRSTLKVLLFVPCYISEWFFILPILILIPAMFDKSKQIFYDKIVGTVVVDYYKHEESHLNVNYVGITRRIIACIVDYSIVIGTSLFYFFLVEIIFSPAEYKMLIVYVCLFFLLSIVFKVLMVSRVGCTPGQLLCHICVKDANTLQSITLVQTIIRYVSLKVVTLIPSAILISDCFYKYIPEPWPYTLLLLILVVITILIFISAVFDRRKQFFHDKIAKTVAIDYRTLS